MFATLSEYKTYIYTFPYEKKLKSIDRVEKDIKNSVKTIPHTNLQWRI